MKQLFTLIALLLTSLTFGQEACPNVHDINSNGTIDIEDFLSILGLFSDVDVDEDGVWDSQDDCLDATACNYLASPTEPCGYLDALGECGGACEGDGDGDGICDDVDTCVGELDECGVCNGPGPTEVVIEDITILYDSVYLPQLEEWYVYEFGADTTFGYECVPEFICGDTLNYQGYGYETVLIGGQCWFAENLRSENYRNGDAIPNNIAAAEWGWLTEGASAVFGEGNVTCFGNATPNGIACDDSWSLDAYGRLYNGHSIADSRKLCPNGWHVPAELDWEVMLSQIGPASLAGVELKSTTGWYGEEGNGTNASGFSGMPGGIRVSIFFDAAGESGYWWSSSTSPDGLSAYMYSLKHSESDVSSSFGDLRHGLSVRCIQDPE